MIKLLSRYRRYGIETILISSKRMEKNVCFWTLGNSKKETKRNLRSLCIT